MAWQERGKEAKAQPPGPDPSISVSVTPPSRIDTHHISSEAVKDGRGSGHGGPSCTILHACLPACSSAALTHPHIHTHPFLFGPWAVEHMASVSSISVLFLGADLHPFASRASCMHCSVCGNRAGGGFLAVDYCGRAGPSQRLQVVVVVVGPMPPAWDRIRDTVVFHTHRTRDNSMNTSSRRSRAFPTRHSSPNPCTATP